MNFPLSADFRPQALLAPRNEITDQSGGKYRQSDSAPRLLSS
jgi:hypothetical protein